MAITALLQFLQNIITAATGNPVAPTPTPTLVELQGLYDDGVTKLNDAVTAETQLALRRGELAEHQKLIISKLTTFIDYANMVTGGDPVKLQSLGLPLRNPPSPPQACEIILGVYASVGDNEGEMTVEWPAQIQADVYEYQTSPDPMAPTSWTTPLNVGKTRLTLTDLTSGQKRWVRVRAYNARGAGPWSDPVCRMIP